MRGGGVAYVPKITRAAKSYIIHVGNLNWEEINPDIFGSMIQVIADEKDRESGGVHYTSVPNILKVLTPLFLDDLNEKLELAKNSERKLFNLRNRISKIRVFDPACGSGNFLVVAYKELRKIEARINKIRGESDRKSAIPLTNFRGIEISHFPVQVARLALNIAEYQCDVKYRGRRDALDDFLPLDDKNWISHANALKTDWLSLCPPTNSRNHQYRSEDFFDDLIDSNYEIDYENEGGETYICGNPPYLNSTRSPEQDLEMKKIFEGVKNWRKLDYVASWIMKAADYGMVTHAKSAFVTTNSICQGSQVSVLWPLIFDTDHQISFAHTSFKWQNLASNNAGVAVIIVGLSRKSTGIKELYQQDEQGNCVATKVNNICPYLIPGRDIIVKDVHSTPKDRCAMIKGNRPIDNQNLLLSKEEKERIESDDIRASKFIRPYVGGNEYISGIQRFCIWVGDDEVSQAESISDFSARFERVRQYRSRSSRQATLNASKRPYRFAEVKVTPKNNILIIPEVSSERRDYLQAGVISASSIVSSKAFAIFDSPLYNFAIISSRLHWVWISAVCGRLENRIRYSNVLGWNTFPIPTFTDKMISDLTQSAEEILLARESYFPSTIADLYRPGHMPDGLKSAHYRCDEVIERIYIGRRFENDTERLEKLFDLYTSQLHQPDFMSLSKAKGSTHYG